MGWIGVDLDGTLAEYHGIQGTDIGAPLKPMLARVREWVDAGREVRIFTARASNPQQVRQVQAWLLSHGLPALAVTNVKDSAMSALYDDKACRVQRNTGFLCGGCYRLRLGIR